MFRSPAGQRMTHDLMRSAKKKGREIDGQNRFPEIIPGVQSRYGITHEPTVA